MASATAATPPSSAADRTSADRESDAVASEAGRASAPAGPVLDEEQAASAVASSEKRRRASASRKRGDRVEGVCRDAIERGMTIPASALIDHSRMNDPP